MRPSELRSSTGMVRERKVCKHAPNMQDTRWRGRLMDTETFWNTSFPRMSIFVTMLPLQLHYQCFVMWNLVPADWCTVSNKAHHKLVCQPGELKRKKKKNPYIWKLSLKKKNKLCTNKNTKQAPSINCCLHMYYQKARVCCWNKVARV